MGIDPSAILAHSLVKTVHSEEPRDVCATSISVLVSSFDGFFFLDTEHKMWVADDPAASGEWAGKEKRVTRSTGGIGCIRWQLSNCVKDRVCFRV